LGRGQCQPQDESAKASPLSISSVVFSRDGTQLAFAGDDPQLTMWELESSQLRHQQFPHHKDPITTLALNPAGDMLATGSQDGTIGLWDAETLLPIGVLPDEQHGVVNSLAFSPDGRTLASGGGGAFLGRLVGRKRRHLALAGL
jgi:WD40 repeat protein